jgi:hypothetical protein
MLWLSTHGTDDRAPENTPLRFEELDIGWISAGIHGRSTADQPARSSRRRSVPTEMEKCVVMPKLFYPGDDAKTRELIQALIAGKYYVNRISQVHIKFETLNYFPTTGTITIDGEGRCPKKGADAFLELLRERYPRRPDLEASKPAETSASIFPSTKHQGQVAPGASDADQTNKNEPSNDDEPPW